MQAASRIAALIVIVLTAARAAVADPEAVAGAMDALRAGDWEEAAEDARPAGPVAQDIVTWHRLRAGLGESGEVMSFLERNPDWPGLDWLRRKSEPVIAEADDATVLAFFADGMPQTGTGALAHAAALERAGETGSAQAGIVLAWRTLTLGAGEQAEFLERHGELLAPHHEARLDMALWQGWERNARAMLPLVSDGWRALAEARLALAEEAPGVDTLIERVPGALADHPGLAYERFAWRVRKGRTLDALELLLSRSTSAASLGEPMAWADLRRRLARDAVQEGDAILAYRIASAHHIAPNDDYAYADLEWLSGYAALKLGNAERAAEHFERFRAAVSTPISLGRAGYWLGRAREAAGDEAGAAAAYALGARYQTSFYGLLAAERGGLPFDGALAGRQPYPDWRNASFTESSVYKAGILLLAAGELSLGERFLTHLAESLDEEELNRMGRMLEELGQPHVGVMLGKRAARAGLTIPAPYYPLHPMAEEDWPVPTELALAIARRESEFDPEVISGAGARGLMQLMPGTAREMAVDLGLDFSLARVLSDWRYNATLGTAYLAELVERFDGNPVMVAAAYNAGPSRPLRWIEENGDPRLGEVDVVDWIEAIPFAETRNYVMRVAESLPVYRARLGRDPHPVPFSEELKGRTLLGG